MGLLDELFNNPENMGLLSAAAAMAERSGPSTRPSSFGQVLSSGLLGGMQGYQHVQDTQFQKKYKGMQMDSMQLQMEEAKRKAEIERQLAEAAQQSMLTPEQMSLAGGGGPTLANAAKIPDMKPQFDTNAYVNRVMAIDPLKGIALQQSMAKQQEEFGTAPQVGTDPVTGKPFTYILGKNGTMRRLDSVLPREKLDTVDLGGKVAFRNPYEASILGALDKSQTPDSVASNAIQIRGQNMTDARARQSLALQQQELGGFGKAPAGFRWKQDGSLEPIPGGPGDKLPEAQQKQVVGVSNLSDAITEYRNDLKNFGFGLNPTKRAVMGTKYNNMMLQAKEAYNLGVLNGPDLEILQSVVIDPTSSKGMLTSTKALDAQAAELDRIMRKVGQVSSKSRPVPPGSGGGNIDDLLKKYGG